MSAPAVVPAQSRTTEGCRYCWMCRQACPVGHVTHRETLTPHGWALLIESVDRDRMAWTPEAVDVLYSCADCGLCQAHCVTDQPLPDAINAARVDVARSGLAPALVYELEQAWRGAASAVPGPAAAPAAAGPVLFVGGDGDAHAAARDAAARLLRAAGREVTPVGAGAPTGSTASSLGLRDLAIEQARAVTHAIAAAGATEVLVLGPGDRWAFDTLYRSRLGLTWPAGVVVREVTDVLAEALSAGRLRFRPADDASAWAYHDPCHTPRVGRERRAPRALLTAALGAATARELFWREHRAHPCGAVGGLNLTQPAIAAKLAAARFADAAAAGARWLISDEPACVGYLRQQAPAGVTVDSLYEVLAERIV